MAVVRRLQKRIAQNERLYYYNRGNGCRGVQPPTAPPVKGQPKRMDSTTTIRTVYFRCDLPRETADALNRESGRLYTQVLVEHYRAYRKGTWLSPYTSMRLNDFYNRDNPRLLHAHSIDAAQEGFAKACKT